MPKKLTVNNIPFSYPTKGDEPGWGGDATDWSTEVTTVLGSLLAPDDIVQTSFDIANAQTASQDVTGLIFNSASARSAVIDYSIYRVSDAQVSGNTETGQIHVVYDNNVGWSMGITDIVGNSGVTFSITPAGQIQYQSTDIGNLNYSGVIKFKASTLQQ